MYEIDDTIVAVSSPTQDKRVIIRLSGPAAIETVNHFFTPAIKKEKQAILSGSFAVDPLLSIDAKAYIFSSPRSYTSDTIVEIHLETNSSVTEAVIERLLKTGIRLAEPGEFTARAYLNGKIDLAQAEAVNEIITSSNSYQLAAARKLLAGRLGQTTANARHNILDILSLIEAGLDFSGEDLEFITADQAAKRLEGIKTELEQLLTGSITYETVIDLPAVGIAGAVNAGKSSLLNRLLGRERSIVSDEQKTTRDILTGQLQLKNSQCILFDCAGLINEPATILDTLAQQAATEAIQNASVVVFCVDISKNSFSEDVSIRRNIKAENIIAIATKSDLVGKDVLDERLTKLSELFGLDFLPISSQNGDGIDKLRDLLDKNIRQLTISPTEKIGVALTTRHRQAINEAIGNITEVTQQLKAGNEEIAAMMLRAACQSLSNIEHEHINTEVLERIFATFCIGK